MKSIIKKLYWGEVMPCKEPSPNTQKYKDTKAHLEQVESEILKQFPALSNDIVNTGKQCGIWLLWKARRTLSEVSDSVQNS